MTRLVALTALALLVLAGPAGAGRERLTPSSRVSTAGLGPVEVGMTRAQAERAGGVRLRFEAGSSGECRYARPRDRAIRASFMFTGRVIARVDVSRRGIATASGFRVGDREAAVRRRFAGRLRITRHAYTDGWYLEYVPRDRAERNRRVIFETDGRRVAQIRAGRLPEVRYIEGCA
jgi:hypothetical protein